MRSDLRTRREIEVRRGRDLAVVEDVVLGTVMEAVQVVVVRRLVSALKKLRRTVSE